jgi:hypothetical protein
MTLEYGVLAMALPAESKSASVKPLLDPLVKPSTETDVTTTLEAKVTCSHGDASQGQ